MEYVIIGNGIAGVSAAESIRPIDREGRITMIGDETFPPYCRPMISMVLEGAVGPDRLPIRGADFYERLDIRPLLGARVSEIDVDGKTVITEKGEAVSFDRLLIASGADPRPIDAEGLDLENIFFMRTEAHVRGMERALPDVRRALVLGGGLVGFKAAYGLMCRGIEVTLLIRSGHPLSMQADPVAGKMILEKLTGRGLDVRTGLTVTAFSGKGRVRQAHLTDGSELPCDLAVIGKGVLPSRSFIPRDHIDLDLGVLVDDYLETNVSGIFAAGDVAETTDIARRSRWVNAIWPEAEAQGRIAGMNMAGQKVRYGGSLSRNVIRIFDTDILTAGIVTPKSDAVYTAIQSKDPLYGTYRKMVFREDRLVGAVLVNRIEQGGVLTALIRSQMPITIEKERLLDPLFNVKTLMKQ